MPSRGSSRATQLALGDQSQALDQMRQGAQKMAEDTQKNGQSRFGQNGETPRDPLGGRNASRGRMRATR